MATSLSNLELKSSEFLLDSARSAVNVSMDADKAWMLIDQTVLNSSARDVSCDCRLEIVRSSGWEVEDFAGESGRDKVTQLEPVT